MQHDAAVQISIVGTAAQLLAPKAILQPNSVIRKGLVIIEMTEFAVKFVVTAVVDFQYTVFYIKGVVEVIVQIVFGDLDIPAGKIFVIEQVDPFLAGGIVVAFFSAGTY